VFVVRERMVHLYLFLILADLRMNSSEDSTATSAHMTWVYVILMSACEASTIGVCEYIYQVHA
jgi:hypothetical protein